MANAPAEKAEQQSILNLYTRVHSLQLNALMRTNKKLVKHTGKMFA